MKAIQNYQGNVYKTNSFIESNNARALPIEHNRKGWLTFMANRGVTEIKVEQSNQFIR